MRICAIWCSVLLATAGMAFGEEPKPAEQGKAAQDVGAGWKALNDEAKALYKQGHYDCAIVAAKKALQVAEQAHGPDHPDVAACLNSLAESYCAQGRYAQAEPLYNRAFGYQRKGPWPGPSRRGREPEQHGNVVLRPRPAPAGRAAL